MNGNDCVFSLLLALHKIFPELPYLGALGKKRIIFSSVAILNSLEKECSTKILFTDKCISPFLCSRLKIDYFQKIEQLKRSSSIANLNNIKPLMLFAETQKECKIQELPHLSDIFSQNIIAVMSTFLYSNKIKQDFMNQINLVKNKGNLGEILDIIAQRKFLKDNSTEYRNNVVKAKNIYGQLHTIISELKARDLLEQKCFRTALTISYLLFSVAVLYIMVRLVM